MITKFKVNATGLIYKSNTTLNNTTKHVEHVCTVQQRGEKGEYGSNKNIKVWRENDLARGPQEI